MYLLFDMNFSSTSAHSEAEIFNLTQLRSWAENVI